MLTGVLVALLRALALVPLDLLRAAWASVLEDWRTIVADYRTVFP